MSGFVRVREVDDRHLSRVTNVNNGRKKVRSEIIGIPFVVTYHPCLANLGYILRKHMYLLNKVRNLNKYLLLNPLYHSQQRAH